jgi:hypothetical protein
VAPTIPALAPAKALWSYASVPTRRRSSRAPRAAGSAATTGKPIRSVAVATEPQQEATAAAAVMTTATIAPTVPPEPAPAGGDRAATVEIPDNDAPPPGWGLWGNWPAPAPEPAIEVLVMREDGCVMLRHPMHSTKASSSRAALPATDGTAAHPEQERKHASAPPAHFSKAQAKQALWQEFCDHSSSLNNRLNEALRIHAGTAGFSRYTQVPQGFPRRVFQVHVLSVGFRSPPPSRLFHACISSDPAFRLASSAGDRSWRAELGRGMTASTN